MVEHLLIGPLKASGRKMEVADSQINAFENYGSSKKVFALITAASIAKR